MKASVESHKTYDACTWDMLPDEIKQLGEVCPVCKRPFPKVEENIEEFVNNPPYIFMNTQVKFVNKYH